MNRAGWFTRSAAALLASVMGAVVLAGCGASDPAPAPATTTSTTSTTAPSAADLISRSAAATRSVTSAHFAIAVSGSVPELQVQSAEGDLTSDGSAKGTASITQAGQLIEVEFVVVAKDLYLKLATGGFTKLPAALAGQVYDPTAILNPETGVAKVLTSATGLSAVSTSGGSYTVTGTVPQAVAASLTPGISSDVEGTFTIDATTSLPQSVAFALTGSDGKPAGVELTLSDFDKAVSITAPSGS